MTEKDKGTNEHLTLEITEVKERQDIGKEKPWWMLEFKAKAVKKPENSLIADDKSHTFKAFSNTKFFEIIEAKGTIDCDINITTKTIERDGEPFTFTNRKITQIYQDGQPVSVKQSGGRSWGKSPEMVMAEIDSKFRNTALMQAVEFSKYLDTKDDTINEEAILDIANRFYGWLTSGKAPKAPQPSPEPRQSASKEKVNDNGVEKLLDAVCVAKSFKTPKTARTWLTNVCKIDATRIDTEPNKVLEEVEPYF